METPMTTDKTKKRPPAEVEATHPEKDLRSPMARAVPEEEVEECFTILRRIHVAVKYFKKSGGGAQSRKRRHPTFDKEDLVEIDGGRENDVQAMFDGEANKVAVEEVVLDLNLDPPSDLTSEIIT
ncbi:Protein NIM1-INTERACTING 2 [Linum perenne]